MHRAVLDERSTRTTWRRPRDTEILLQDVVRCDTNVVLVHIRTPVENLFLARGCRGPVVVIDIHVVIVSRTTLCLTFGRFCWLLGLALGLRLLFLQLPSLAFNCDVPFSDRYRDLLPTVVDKDIQARRMSLQLIRPLRRQ